MCEYNIDAAAGMAANYQYTADGWKPVPLTARARYLHSMILCLGVPHMDSVDGRREIGSIEGATLKRQVIPRSQHDRYARTQAPVPQTVLPPC